MKVIYIGLGKMGHNMAERLAERGYEVFAFDVSEDARKSAERAGAKTAGSLDDLVKNLDSPRVIWIMVPHKAVDGVLRELSGNLSEGDTVIDGGNSFYKDSIIRAGELAERGVKFLDVGVSGGPEGARNGAALMVGGEKEDFEKLEPLFRDLAVENGYGYVGAHGAGHFVKMVHNGIEYGMMQAIAEGFAVMKKSEFNLNLKKAADIYNHGSVVESRLIKFLAEGFEEFGQEMEGVSGSVAQSGEGVWTVEAAKELKVPVKIIEDALKFRLDSEGSPSYTGKLLSAMRNRFGGHRAK